MSDKRLGEEGAVDVAPGELESRELRDRARLASKSFQQGGCKAFAALDQSSRRRSPIPTMIIRDVVDLFRFDSQSLQPRQRRKQTVNVSAGG